VCFRVGKAPTRRNLGAASPISFVMVAEVSSINAFRTRTNSSGMIEDEELSFQAFGHVIVSSIWARQREENSISVVLWKRPSGGRVEREENRTFVPPNLVDHIPSIGVVEAKKNL
jgi:hypothetical protein